MDCLRFQQLISDFIYDRIENSKTLEEFLEHGKTCEACKEELHLYYTIHRGLGDVMSPGENDDGDLERELNDIFKFYDEYFAKERIMKRAGKASIIAVIIIAFLTALYMFFKFELS